MGCEEATGQKVRSFEETTGQKVRNWTLAWFFPTGYGVPAATPQDRGGRHSAPAGRSYEGLVAGLFG